MHQSKQAKIEELERSLEIEAANVRSLNDILARERVEKIQEISKVRAEREHYASRALMVDTLLEIIKNLSVRKSI